jgi:drug/metabolite transporter (DMT)-like permease
MNRHQARRRWLIGLSLVTLYFIWGSTFISMKFAMDSFPPFMMAALRFLCAGALLYGLLHGEHMSAVPSTKALLAMAYLVIFGSFIAYSAYLYLLRTVRPALATSYALVNPLVAMLLGGWLADERFGASELLALLAILGGVLLVLSAKSG